MQTGISNDAKAQVRKAFAKGEVGREELLASETAAYHGPGTCTFYGTANSNQMLLEMMGVQLPGSSFINPGEEIRELLTDAAVEAAQCITRERSLFANRPCDRRAGNCERNSWIACNWRIHESHNALDCGRSSCRLVGDLE